MMLKVVLPTEMLLTVEVEKIIAEGEEGNYCILPKHVNLFSSLVPGILSFTPCEGDEQYMAVDQGLLVKCDEEVLVSTRHAAIGPALSVLRDTVRNQYLSFDEHERHARSEFAKLEAGFVRKFIEHQKV